MSVGQGKRKYNQFAVGWLKDKEDGTQYISASANGKLQKIKLIAQLEDGTSTPINSFAVFFNKEKANEKAPDVQFVFSTEG